MDIAFGNPDGTYRAGPHYLASDPSTGAWSVALGDYNRDGKLDAAVNRMFLSTDRPDDLLLLFGNGDGTLQTPIPYDAGIGAGMIRSGDINGDGALDLVCGESTLGGQGVGVLLNHGDGSFRAASFYNGGFSSARISLGDLNNDGRLDVVAGNFQSATVGLLYGRGDGTLIAQYASPMLAGIQYMTTGDANRDGILDVAFINFTDGVDC